MTEEKAKRVNVMLYQESLDILEFFDEKEMKASGTVRLALKAFYTAYVKKAVENGEMEVDVDGKASVIDQLVATPRREMDTLNRNLKEDDQTIVQEE